MNTQELHEKMKQFAEAVLKQLSFPARVHSANRHHPELSVSIQIGEDSISYPGDITWWSIARFYVHAKGSQLTMIHSRMTDEDATLLYKMTLADWEALDPRLVKYAATVIERMQSLYSEITPSEIDDDAGK